MCLLSNHYNLTWSGSWKLVRLTSCFMSHLPRSSEKLIPSLIFPPTTQKRTAPLGQALFTAEFWGNKITTMYTWLKTTTSVAFSLSRARKGLHDRTAFMSPLLSITEDFFVGTGGLRVLTLTLIQAAYDDRTWSSWFVFFGSRNTLRQKKRHRFESQVLMQTTRVSNHWVQRGSTLSNWFCMFVRVKGIVGWIQSFTLDKTCTDYLPFFLHSFFQECQFYSSVCVHFLRNHTRRKNTLLHQKQRQKYWWEAGLTRLSKQNKRSKESRGLNRAFENPVTTCDGKITQC